MIIIIIITVMITIIIIIIIAVYLIVNFIIFDFLVNLDKMTHVRVEIKKAGDGINYPQKGRTVTIHYSGHYKIHKILKLTIK